MLKPDNEITSLIVDALNFKKDLYKIDFWNEDERKKYIENFNRLDQLNEEQLEKCVSENKFLLSVIEHLNELKDKKVQLGTLMEWCIDNNQMIESQLTNEFQDAICILHIYFYEQKYVEDSDDYEDVYNLIRVEQRDLKKLYERTIDKSELLKVLEKYSEKKTVDINALINTLRKNNNLYINQILDRFKKYQQIRVEKVLDLYNKYKIINKYDPQSVKQKIQQHILNHGLYDYLYYYPYDKDKILRLTTIPQIKNTENISKEPNTTIKTEKHYNESTGQPPEPEDVIYYKGTRRIKEIDNKIENNIENGEKMESIESIRSKYKNNDEEQEKRNKEQLRRINEKYSEFLNKDKNEVKDLINTIKKTTTKVRNQLKKVRQKETIKKYNPYWNKYNYEEKKYLRDENNQFYKQRREKTQDIKLHSCKKRIINNNINVPNINPDESRYKHGLIQSIIKKVTILLKDNYAMPNYYNTLWYYLKKELRNQSTNQLNNICCEIVKNKDSKEKILKGINKDFSGKYYNNEYKNMINEIINLGKNYLKNQSRW